MLKYIILIIVGISSNLLPAAERVLEVSGDGRKIVVSISFLEANETSNPAQTFEINNKGFDWISIPENAIKFRVKTGEIYSQILSLDPVNNTFAKVGEVKHLFDSSGVAILYLDVTTSSKERVPKDSLGYVFIGQLESPVKGSNSQWKSLYVVRKNDRKSLDVDNPGTFEVVSAKILNKEVFADFPLYLRGWNFDANRPVHNNSDKIVRAGQVELIKKIMEPDAQGRVYAEVSIR